jgi:hypothetical protein
VYKFVATPTPTPVAASAATPLPTPPPWVECTGAARVGGNQSTITCTLPPGSGANLYVTVVSGGSPGTSTVPLLSYDKPVVASLSSSYVPSNASWGAIAPCNALPPAVGTPVNTTGELTGPTTGCFLVTVAGSNFGPDQRNYSGVNCIFVASRARDLSRVPVCSGSESFAGEGEIYNSGFANDSWLTAWSDTSITFVMPHGVGDADVLVYAAGQTQAVSSTTGFAEGPSFAYYAPNVTALSKLNGTTRGGDAVTLTGSNFGVTPTNLTYPPWGLPLPLNASYLPPLHALRVNWGTARRPAAPASPPPWTRGATGRRASRSAAWAPSTSARARWPS